MSLVLRFSTFSKQSAGTESLRVTARNSFAKMSIHDPEHFTGRPDVVSVGVYSRRKVDPALSVVRSSGPPL